jgi:anhydro-N-acetylmuramic acid kinase
MTNRWIIGLASGSSGADVEATLLEIEGAGLDLQARPVHTLHLALARDLRQLLHRIGGPINPLAPSPLSPGGEGRVRQIAEQERSGEGIDEADGSGRKKVKQISLLHRLLGETFAAAARQVADRASFGLQRVQCLGCPGHTIWHDPEGRFPSTMALGMAAVVAERTGVTTVSDFPSRDLAAGGQGAPVSALVDYLLFRHAEESRILLHLGGVARIVYLPAAGKVHDVLGFDASPCNRLLDGLIAQMTNGRESFDPGGKHAVQGRCVESLLEQWLALAYLKRRPPKSLPEHGLAEDLILQAVHLGREGSCQLHDLVCTATHFVARSIRQSCQRFLPVSRVPMRVLLSGGGTRNGFLWHLLEQQFAPIPLSKTIVVPVEARKSVSAGILAALTVDGVPANLPPVTGAQGARLLGSVTPGSPANWARCLAWMAVQTAPPTEIISDE